MPPVVAQLLVVTQSIMAEACPICLLPAADPATCTVCSNHHPIHTACARDMLARMGRDACPVCLAPITALSTWGSGATTRLAAASVEPTSSAESSALASAACMKA